MVKVFFLKSEEDVFAFFPENKYSDVNVDLRVSYALGEGHSPCHVEYAEECEQASQEESLDLYNNLTKVVGYDLDVLNENFK